MPFIDAFTNAAGSIRFLEFPFSVYHPPLLA
jgi:hypothetical protein